MNGRPYARTASSTATLPRLKDTRARNSATIGSETTVRVYLGIVRDRQSLIDPEAARRSLGPQDRATRAGAAIEQDWPRQIFHQPSEGTDDLVVHHVDVSHGDSETPARACVRVRRDGTCCARKSSVSSRASSRVRERGTLWEFLPPLPLISFRPSDFFPFFHVICRPKKTIQIKQFPITVGVASNLIGELLERSILIRMLV